MQTNKCKFVLIILLGNLFFVNNVVVAQSKKDVITPTQLFLKIEAELKNGKSANFINYRAQLKNYPLYPYLEYKHLVNNLHNIDAKSINSFIQQYPDLPNINTLRSTWLLQQAKQKQWQAFLQVYTHTSDVALRCHYLHAQMQTSSLTDQLLVQIVPLWLVGSSQPEACTPIFALLEKSKLLTKTMIWKKIQLAIEQEHHDLAIRLATKLSVAEKHIVKLWVNTSINPYMVRRYNQYTASHPAVIEALVAGISGIAKEEPELASRIWSNVMQHKTFTDRHTSIVASAIGLKLAEINDPNTLYWINKISPKYRNEKINNINLQIALKKNDWKNIIHLTANIRGQDVDIDKWRYWHARTLEMLNVRHESQKIYSSLIQNRNYYGFLSSERLLKTFNIKNQTSQIVPDKLNKILYVPSIMRTKEWLKLNRMASATREWNNALYFLSEDEKQAAAKLAHSWNLPYWAILALANAEAKDDLELRFPKLYSQDVFQAAKHNSIDPAWIYSITRQESAFVHDAKSSVGALGLMQIMPSTGKMLATHFKTSFNHTDLLNPSINIKYGSKYLKMMLKAHNNNTVLATASYNAGAFRVKSWLPDHDIAADAWIETIPFFETRNYVKNVLTYTVIYQQLLGARPELRSKMPIIAGKNTL